ncbi:MAG: antibiotic biosynthesis monooxygenase [Crocinitomicaceae bacterium]|nr:antibiotic biosynthesis monooxygenase [Crocinitomicaceae bacterium]
MITRIVKMTLQPEKVSEFLSFFDTIKHQINTFEGCKGVKLLQDKNQPNILFTYSFWESEKALNNYRHSELFGKVWPTTKIHFADKPEAWSTDEYFDGFK